MKTTVDYKEIEALSKQYYKLSITIINHNKYIAYSLTHHSTAIEGSTLTESQVINLLEFGKTATTKPYEHHLMVSDFYKAFLFMNYYSKENKQLNINFIQELAGLVVKSTSGLVSTIGGDFDISKGEFRLCSVRAGNRFFPDYKKVPKLVTDFIKEQFLLLFPVLIIWIAGLIWFLRNGAYRIIAWIYFSVILLLVFGSGKSYYALGVYPVLLAAGSLSSRTNSAKSRSPVIMRRRAGPDRATR